MARIRSLKPEAFQSETLSEVSVFAERTFLGLSTQVDDQGRIADKPVVNNAALWAVRSERVPHPVAEFEGELDELVSAGLVCRYVGCDGKRYLHLVTWRDHQKVDKPGKPRTPRCPFHQVVEECGKHAMAPCPALPPQPDNGKPREDVANSRESSRALELPDTDTTRTGGVPAPVESHSNSREDSRDSLDNLPMAADLQGCDSSRTLASPREPSTLDLGSRTLDLGSKTSPLPPAVDPATSATAEIAKPGEGESPDQDRTTNLTLVAEVRDLRPDWTTQAIVKALSHPEVLERPQHLVPAAMLAVARDPDSKFPGRLSRSGPWWGAAPAAAPTPTPPTYKAPAVVERATDEGKASALGPLKDADWYRRAAEKRPEVPNAPADQGSATA